MAWVGVALLAAVRPGQEDPSTILERRCVECHNPAKRKGGLDLTTREGLRKGGQSGPAVEPGPPERTLLWRLVAHEEEPFMPHRAPKLPPASLRALREWLAAGAPYARSPLKVPEAPAERHWAFRPPARPEPPEVRDASWVRTPVDRFILAALESRGWTPSAPADRRRLIRRVFFDLWGLPPSPEEIEAFVNDPAPEAYERLVDRLLAGPAFGERWARHWLDVARYADSDGYRFDNDRKHAWPYRDFVIRAFNEDLPFDTFVRWQIAGDELAPGNPLAAAATGFCTAGPVQERQSADAPRNQERNRYDELDDVLSTLGQGFLGLTLGCARCHDHKYDPIPTREYYRMLAAFIDTRRREVPLVPPAEAEAWRRLEEEYQARVAPLRRELEAFLSRAREPLFRRKVQALRIREEDREILLAPRDPSNQRQQELLTVHQKELRVSEAELRGSLSPAERAEWDRRAAAIREAERGRPPAPPFGLVLTDAGPEPSRSPLLERGEVDAKKELLTLGFLSALGDPEPRLSRPPGARTSFQRAALAEWLTDVERGAGALLARVIVNRLWQHHFGEGLVRTPNDFGAQGERPTHPELLEWLASELVRRGWRLKEIHRLILTSAVYVQDTSASPGPVREDPENRLLARRRPRRLEAEALRDALLAVSGRLNPKMYGPGVKVPIPAEAIITRTEGEHHYPRDVRESPEVWRRTVYVFVKRSVPYPLTEVFDAPSPSASCGRRVSTTVAPQALALLNDPFVRGCAWDFADRVLREAGPGAGARIERAWALALGRAPTPREREAAEEFLGRAADERRGLADLGHTLFMTNEFAYVD
ncbi:MAG TPA: PSD1 and planctomycete cytochrome C domain-containing protein [Planctomycetota bacterium]|nr:PSD1 and planctomycete cytochrome C domain-containing protein [Planctomycetota bacterium]